MLQPKRTKFRKMHKGRIRGEAKGGSDLNFGTFGLKAIEPERVTARQIEAARRAMTRHMKRQGRVWIRIFPDTPVTSKPVEVRMGKGKGSVDFWACKVKPGRIMFELDGVNEDVAREALRLAAMKLPVKTRTVAREDWLSWWWGETPPYIGTTRRAGFHPALFFCRISENLQFKGLPKTSMSARRDNFERASSTMRSFVPCGPA